MSTFLLSYFPTFCLIEQKKEPTVYWQTPFPYCFNKMM